MFYLGNLRYLTSALQHFLISKEIIYMQCNEVYMTYDFIYLYNVYCICSICLKKFILHCLKIYRNLLTVKTESVVVGADVSGFLGRIFSM